MQSLHTPAESEQPSAQSLPATPCDCFDMWAVHADERIAQAGSALRARWCREALAHPALSPLVSFIKRCWREHYPDGATAGSAWYDLAMLAAYLHKLEARAASSEGAE